MKMKKAKGSGKKVEKNKEEKTDIREKFLRGIEHIFSMFKANNTLINVVTASLLIPGSRTLLRGIPGTGKTTLLRMLAKAFFASDFTKVSFSQNITPFDVFYYLNLGKLTKGIEEVTPRRIVTARYKLFNELGRCPPAVQNELLELLEEKQKSYRDKVFKSPEGVFFFDMNPQDATSVELSDALLDRMDVVVEVPALDMRKEFELLYDMETGLKDLVEATPQCLTPEEMQQIWGEVDRVRVEPHVMFYMTILRASVTRCRYYDKSLVPSDFIEQKCETCTYKNEFCHQLQSCNAFRITSAARKYAKAFAWLRGDGEVTFDDVIKAFAVALPHRIKLRPKFRNQYGTPYLWVRDVFIPHAAKTKDRLWRESAKLLAEVLKGNDKAKEELRQRGDKDVAVYSLYEDWLGRKKELFAKLLWRQRR